MSSIAPYAARVSILALTAGSLLASCTYLQKRSLHEFSGVVLHADNDRPVEGVTLVLSETRHPFIFFPFATDSFQSIAHTVTDSNGRFSFRVCMTERSYDLLWDQGQNYRKNLWLTDGPRNVRVRLYTKPANDTFASNLIKAAIEQEDSSLTESCV
jgi:hypothetical protein